MITNLRNYAPTEIIALTPNGVAYLLDALNNYSPEPHEQGLHELLLLQLRSLKAPHSP